MKKFNTTAVCIPEKHYMVDLSSRIEKIRTMVRDGKYFVIHRGRQYGKTTTLYALKNRLQDEYVVISLDFQVLGNEGFSSEAVFVQNFSRLLLKRGRGTLCIPKMIEEQLKEYSQGTTGVLLNSLFDTLSEWCGMSEKPLVLMIDEVDSASNTQVFMDFLAQLRAAYIARDTENEPAFQSVILAGVTDIRHVKHKLRPDAMHKINSPWNIDAGFSVSMSFTAPDISGMLQEYEEDHHTGMNTDEIARDIVDYTGGYPVLVSRMCQIMDEELVPEVFETPALAWSRWGVDEAARKLLGEKNMLFESLTGTIRNNPSVRKALYEILMEGKPVSYNLDQDLTEQLQMYGYIRNKDNTIAIANRIFETRLYNLFLADEEMNDNPFVNSAAEEKNLFVKNHQLDMPLILEHFVKTYHMVFGPLEDKFKEKDGRELFLLYLKPIINGTGNYYIEAQTRTQTRTDVIVDYLGHQYVIELKIWRGPRYNEEGEKQLLSYLEYFGLDVGYLVSFCFTKKKKTGLDKIAIQDKILYEAIL